MKKDLLPFLWLAALSGVVFSNTLTGASFIRDDRFIIAENPLLRGPASLPKLLSTGYWEGAVGSEAPVQEFRPLLMLSYALTLWIGGATPWIFHLINLLLHAANAMLLFALLRRRYAFAAALGAASLFAALPVHVEAVAYISGRSELLVTLFLLLAWLEMDRTRPRTNLGLLWFLCALFCKEQAVLFPFVLAMDDWAFHGRKFWDRQHRPRYLVLLGAVAASLALRSLVLDRAFHGGFDYFAGKSYLTRLLTMSRFAFRHYLLPSVLGLGLRSEFTRPFFPDSGPGELAGWAAFGAWAAAGALAAFGLIRRRARWAFWALAAFVWLLPVSNLIIRLDTIGAERFLYLPSIGLCVLMARLPTPALAAILVWFGALSFDRNRVWADDLAYYRTAVADSPASAKALSGLGVALVERGKTAEAESALRRAIALNPDPPAPHYNLGKLYFDEARWAQAERCFREALARSPRSVDTLLFLAALHAQRGDFRLAEEDYRKALEFQPWNDQAHFNLGQLYLRRGRPREAREHFERFLSLAPNDPQAPEIRALLEKGLQRK